jgi:hypothetical protein
MEVSHRMAAVERSPEDDARIGKLIERIDDGGRLTEEELAYLDRFSEPADDVVIAKRRPASTPWSMRIPTPLLDEIERRANLKGEPIGRYMIGLLKTGLVFEDDPPPEVAAQVLARLLESMPPEVQRAATGSGRSPRRR